MNVKKLNNASYVNNINDLSNLTNKCVNNHNTAFYDDVLAFLNAVFNKEETSILRIKITTYEISENILHAYNEIIDKHGLKLKKIDVAQYDFDEEPTKEGLLEVVLYVCNTLLKKLEYKVKINLKNSNKNLLIVKDD